MFVEETDLIASWELHATTIKKGYRAYIKMSKFSTVASRFTDNAMSVSYETAGSLLEIVEMISWRQLKLSTWSTN